MAVHTRRPGAGFGRGTGLLAMCLASAVVLAAMHQAIADDDEDEKRALRSGEVVPVEQLLGEIRQRYDGRVLKVELEREWRIGGRIWVYEAKLLTSDGDVLKLEYDAGTLELLEQKGPEREGRGRGGED